MIRNWQENDKQYEGELKNFTNNVSRWLELEYTNSELCFVWIEESYVKGGIAYAAGGAESIHILDFSLNQDSFHLGAELLIQSLRRVSARNVCYQLYNDSEQYDDYKKCFLDADFKVSQKKLSYRFTNKSLEHKENEVEFRSYTDIGEKEFVKAIALVTHQTLDSMEASSVTQHGQLKAAEILIKELKDIDFQPEIWMLAYVNDSLIGLVIPSNFGDNYGAINYIGVVPAERGKGYVDYLLHKGTQLLLNQGVTTVIADIDVSNFPMEYALERIGYKRCQELIIFEKRYNKF